MKENAKECNVIAIQKDGRRTTTRKKDLLDYVDEIVRDNVFYGIKTGCPKSTIAQYKEQAMQYKKALMAAIRSGVTDFAWDKECDLPAVPGFEW